MISSGYDVEFLMGEEYIRNFLLSSMETGSIAWWSESEVTGPQGQHIRTDVSVTHPPKALNQRRLYPVHPDFLGHEHPFLDLGVPAYSGQDDEFAVTLLPDAPGGADIAVKVYPTIITDTDHPAWTKVEISNALPINLELRFELDFTPPRRRPALERHRAPAGVN